MSFVCVVLSYVFSGGVPHTVLTTLREARPSVSTVSLSQIGADRRALCLLGRWHTEPPLPFYAATELSGDILTLSVQDNENNEVSVKITYQETKELDY